MLKNYKNNKIKNKTKLSLNFWTNFEQMFNKSGEIHIPEIQKKNRNKGVAR